MGGGVRRSVGAVSHWELSPFHLVASAINFELFIPQSFNYRLIVTVVIWTYHSHYLDCEDVKTLHIYLAGTLVMLTLITTVDLVLARHSMKGTIMDTRPRRHVPRIIYIRLCHSIKITFKFLTCFWWQGSSCCLWNRLDSLWDCLGLSDDRSMLRVRDDIDSGQSARNLQLGPHTGITCLDGARLWSTRAPHLKWTGSEQGAAGTSHGEESVLVGVQVQMALLCLSLM